MIENDILPNYPPRREIEGIGARRSSERVGVHWKAGGVLKSTTTDMSVTSPSRALTVLDELLVRYDCDGERRLCVDDGDGGKGETGLNSTQTGQDSL